MRKKITIMLIKFQKRISIDINQIQTKKNLTLSPDQVFLRLSINKNTVHIGK